MKILQDKENSIWNKFILANNASFLQSFEWGEFQQALGKKVWRLEVGDSDVLKAQVVKETFPFFGKSFLYIPFGPVFNINLSQSEKDQAFKNIINEAREIAKKENAIFLLIEPEKELPRVGEYKLQKPIKRIQPEETLILDLLKTENEIFANFNSITRYNIRLAERKGVKAFEADITKENIDIFYSLLSKTSQRDKFTSYSKSYFENFFNNSNGLSKKLFFCQYQDKIIAANIMIYFGNTATHLHGASDHQLRQVKAPQFLQWHQIKDAKKAGFSEYDFWGISTKKWPSLTEYKKGFGGIEKAYPQGQAFIFQNFWFSIYKMIKGK